MTDPLGIEARTSIGIVGPSVPSAASERVKELRVFRSCSFSLSVHMMETISWPLAIRAIRPCTIQMWSRQELCAELWEVWPEPVRPGQ